MKSNIRLCKINVRITFRRVEERGWSSDYSKLWDSSCFGIFRVSNYRIDLVIRLKGGRNPFWGPILGPKAPKFPKSISREPLVVESWLTPQNDRNTWFTIGVLRHVYFSDNQKSPKNTIFWFLEPYNDKVAWFSISGELPIFENGWPLKMSVVDMYIAQLTRSAQKMPFFLALYHEILKVPISRELYIILNWLTFQKDRKTNLSISV